MHKAFGCDINDFSSIDIEFVLALPPASLNIKGVLNTVQRAGTADPWHLVQITERSEQEGT